MVSKRARFHGEGHSPRQMDTSLDRNPRERPTIQTGKAKVTGFHVKDTPDRPGGQLSKELTKTFIQWGAFMGTRSSSSH